MKILFIHNLYGVTSGEEVMIHRIMDLLQTHGHEINTFFKTSSDLKDTFPDKSRALAISIYSSASRREIIHSINEFQPDLVQVQNLYPLVSPSILPVISSFHIPIVMRLANYRLICPNGLFLSRGQVCERCRGGKEYWCVLRNCEGNLFKSFGYALRNYVARKMEYYKDSVTYYYAQTKFQKEYLVKEGFPTDRIDIIPNMLDENQAVNVADLGEYVAYAGRVSPEKGAPVFLGAARGCRDISFKLAGDYQRMQCLLHGAAENVEFLGNLDKKPLAEFYNNCRLFVMPTLCFEGLPGVIIEAMSHGKPVICSRIGGLSEIVEDGKTGFLFEPGNPNDLTEKINYLWERPELCRQMGAAGREKVLQEYSSEKYYNRLMRVYEKAIAINEQHKLK